MKKHNVNSAEQGMGRFVLVCHLGMMLFGIIAWLTGDAADDHKKYEHFWFTIHSWIGMGLVTSPPQADGVSTTVIPEVC